MKACRDCKYCYNASDEWACCRPRESKIINFYTGESRNGPNQWIDDERGNEKLCGLEAKYFEAK